MVDSFLVVDRKWYTVAGTEVEWTLLAAAGRNWTPLVMVDETWVELAPLEAPGRCVSPLVTVAGTGSLGMACQKDC